MEKLSACPHCGQKPNISRMLDETVIECLDHDLVAQAADNEDAAVLWETIVDIRINAKNLTTEVTS